ncbi:MAG: ABC transporter substrate-binding protein [Tepidanaerobacteraceae bacterium]|jgi:peptide/nickel transport system substrate-binding protein|nr:ABC transporter substrate-binding protein [Thermoanaerobacterales bacterium]
MNKRLFFSVFGLMLILVLTITGCGSQESTVENDGGTLVIALPRDIPTLDPANHRLREAENVIRNIFDGLITKTHDGKIVPEIAESWEIISDTEWEFKIREGVTFHNGEPLTADDVVFSFERIIKEGAMEGQTSPRKGLMGSTSDVYKVDDYTVRFNNDEPNPTFLHGIAHQQIIPKDYFEEVGIDGFLEHPVGAGPFKFVSGTLNDQIVLERYDDYYGGSPEIPPVGPPALKRVIFKVIPETSSAIAALKNGEVNIISAIPPDMVQNLRDDPNINVKTVQGTRVYMLEMNNKMPPFDNPKVRQAMNYAINTDMILETIYEGNATRLSGALMPYSLGANPNLKPYEYNPEKAKQLLKEAGVTNLKVVIDTEPKRQNVASAMAAMLQEIGIDAQVRNWEWGVLQSEIENGARQMYMTDWGDSWLDPVGFLNPKFKTNDRGNWSHYSNEKVDKLLTEAERIVDVERREEIYHEVEEILYEEAPIVFGYTLMEVEASTANVENWQPSMDGRQNMHRVRITN